MLTYAVKEYVTVTETHIDARFFGNIRKYCKTFFKYNYTQIDECVDFFESEIPPTEEQVVERWRRLVWQFAENYKDFGTHLEFVTNRSQDGSQFVKGFGGIGGLLRYKVDFNENFDDEYFEDDESPDY